MGRAGHVPGLSCLGAHIGICVRKEQHAVTSDYSPTSTTGAYASIGSLERRGTIIAKRCGSTYRSPALEGSAFHHGILDSSFCEMGPTQACLTSD